MSSSNASEDKEFSTTELTESWDYFEVSVNAKDGWKDTGISVGETEILYMEWISGSWNGDGRRNPYHGPNGPTRDAYIAPSGYPLPGHVEDSLVGRVGGTVFFIGERIRSRVRSSGNLALTINDTGHHDNDGSVTMRVSVRRS